MENPLHPHEIPREEKKKKKGTDDFTKIMMVLVRVPHHALHDGVIVLHLAIFTGALFHRAALRDLAADAGILPRTAVKIPEMTTMEKGNPLERSPR